MARFGTILLTGVNGQVGYELQHTLSVLGRAVALDRSQLDLSDPDAIRRVVRELKPNLIINPAAYTAVDKAESEPDLAFAINAIAPAVLAEEAGRLDATLVHYSTDYVYDGSKSSPYVETDPTNPLSAYGKSKLAGEEAIRAVGVPHLILRTSWVYGARGKNFLRTILRLAAERE
ncbi:MAG: dTDP-4-dehydrorhamnose reductase, partial [Methylophilaceae bacterium]